MKGDYMNLYAMTEEQRGYIGAVLAEGKYKDVFQCIDILRSLEKIERPSQEESEETKA